MKRATILSLALAGCSPATRIAPGQIVSNNPCVDAVLAEIAAPGQIGAVSNWSHDPASASAPLSWARALPALGPTAEEVIAARPKLLLTGNLASGGTHVAIQKAGITMRAFGVPATIAESMNQVIDIADSIDRSDAGKSLARQIEIAASPTPARGKAKSAIIWQSGGFVPGKGTLQDELLARAGFTNASAAYGLKQWDILPVETLLRRPPDVIFMPDSATGEDGKSLAARQRLLRHLGKTTRIMPFPDKLLFCGGPTIIEAMQRMKAAA